METLKHPHPSNPALVVPLGQPLPPPSKRPAPRQKPPPAVHLIAGGLGGMCGSIVTAPFDVVKTRLQSDLFQQRVAGPAKASSRTGIRALLYNFVDTAVILRDVYRYEGPTALFKGLGPTLAGVVPGRYATLACAELAKAKADRPSSRILNRSINFFVYGNGKHVYAEWFNHGIENTPVHLAAAATAGESAAPLGRSTALSLTLFACRSKGVATAAATNPIWVVKTVMQLQQHQRQFPSSNSPPLTSSSSPSPSSKRPLPNPPKSKQQIFSHSFRSLSSPPLPLASPPPRPTSYSTAVMIFRTQGVRGFYKGLSASLLGVTEGTIQWGLYEQFKRMAKAGTAEEEEAGWRVSIAAGAAKLVATVITYPHEVIRTRLRQPVPPSGIPKYVSLVQAFQLVVKEEGWRALYGGMSPHLLRVVPNAITMFWVYERVIGLAEKRQAEKTRTDEEARIE
ncbi:SPOSA6832_00115 [Sporobolomyces salmonicolor]|uniref:SPOSA6832_00115-mRNA-1:cds n=1 Tax=Sporidiobolus salmonicolor TaxID=5005 RepID=A0A0D6EFM1_SPOSA|nr:SPOSA6832_00115 [Sporobolomyces salmonicolor]